MSVAVQAMSATAHAPVVPNYVPSLQSHIVDNDRLSQMQPRVSFARRPLPPQPNVTRSSSSMSASPLTRSARTSFISSDQSTSLATVCANCQVLSRLLEFISWADCHSLSGTSRAIRRVFLDANIKEVVFSRFIPGYRTALRARDRRLWEDNVRMDYVDLGLLTSALDTPLQHFPMHALSLLSSDLPTFEQMHTTHHLQRLSQAHSRAVLVLQNLVHSNARPVPSDLDSAVLKATNGSSTQTGLRELTFPAPLSYATQDGVIGKSHSCPPSVSGDTAIQASASSLKGRTFKSQKRQSRNWGSESTFPEPDAGRVRRDRSTSRLSIFGGNAQRPPLPQPATQPESLRIYSGTWRRSYYGPPPSEDGVLLPPKRRFASSRNTSNSSLGSSPSPSSSRHCATPASSSPHDLYAATKRNRAPILRVFVPCSVFTDEIITACEDQLVDDGLWDHLSVGDIVCNFGYVPLVDESEENAQEKDHRRWLIFTGEQLDIYHPTRPPPIAGALSLPSPFYYIHILPTFINPRLRLILPPSRAQFSLSVVMTRVASSHASSGYARVKTFAWLATFDAHPLPGSPMSSGWAGEWVLQGEGTPEGKIALQDALQGGQEAEHEYEIVLENSGGGKLWLRMISSAPVSRTSESMDLRT
ncbi:uncharacterized protein FOMMEDRAFT_17042 [Fomitiporia mediterranea MF3/22]|uniref:uncharacterized protein n=1 Tax=Fomitiporia mediterranea (strain MF3/22) TaxID=694068 RepID=UPI0004408B06|nr:uncharacterized protein FOMMEDRAFT_17042 [Fomitiporia mediterranea MF3/22]EJD06508.1 hypothetical protein FOMMEDRAFT_17042 [Fomitiporia mediterranea MF3/22]